MSHGKPCRDRPHRDRKIPKAYLYGRFDVRLKSRRFSRHTIEIACATKRGCIVTWQRVGLQIMHTWSVKFRNSTIHVCTALLRYTSLPERAALGRCFVPVNVSLGCDHDLCCLNHGTSYGWLRQLDGDPGAGHHFRFGGFVPWQHQAPDTNDFHLCLASDCF